MSVFLATPIAMALFAVLFGVGWNFLCRTPQGMVTPATGLLLRASKAFADLIISRDIVERRKQGDADIALISSTPRKRVLVDEVVIEGPAGQLRLRSYRPAKREPSSILLFLHGGGWVVGSVQFSDPVTRSLCVEAEALVLSLDYRLAPESPFPAAVEDVAAAYAWILAEVEAGRLPRLPVFVAGESAGGNLAAVLCLVARERRLPAPAGQILFYPVTDISRTESESYDRFGEGFLLSRADMRWFIGLYAPDEADRRDFRASPLLAPDLSGLPPALVFTAAFDVLRDEGEAYAARLRSAGVRVEARRMRGLVHGFVSMGRFVPEAKGSMRAAAQFMRGMTAG